MKETKYTVMVILSMALLYFASGWLVAKGSVVGVVLSAISGTLLFVLTVLLLAGDAGDED